MKELLKKTSFYKWYVSRKIEQENQEIKQNNKRIRGPLMEKYLPKNSIGAELGVLKGHFSRVLLESTQAKELHLIDPWYFLGADWPWSGGNTSTVDAVCSILNEFKTEINEQKVYVHIQDDCLVLSQFPDSYFDWVYIDSSHAYVHTLQELEILKMKVKPDGIICGDDWQPDPTNRHHGVFKAVKEFTDKENYEILYSSSDNLQWFIKRKS